MGVSPSHSEPRAEMGSLDEAFFRSAMIQIPFLSTTPLVQVSTVPSGCFAFKNDGGKYGRPRTTCKPVQLDRIATWNIEGMAGTSQVKFAELRVFMKENGISILCIQETHVIHTDHYIEDGFSIFLSGAGENVSRSYAGVGFIVAPWAIAAVVNFKLISDKLANLQVKVIGEVLNLVS